MSGLAVGVGFSFALHGDLIVAADDAYFWANFSDIGLIPDGGLSALLPQHLGYHRAMAHVLLAEKISVPDAINLGLVYRGYPKRTLQQHALTLAQNIADQSNIVNQEAKQLLRGSFGRSLEDQLKAECVSQARAGFSPEAKVAIMRFLSRQSHTPQDGDAA